MENNNIITDVPQSEHKHMKIVIKLFAQEFSTKIKEISAVGAGLSKGHLILIVVASDVEKVKLLVLLVYVEIILIPYMLPQQKMYH